MDIKQNFDPSRQTIRHGEVYFIPIKSAPDGREFEVTDGRYIVGHSETGHFHTIRKSDDVLVMERPEGEAVPEGMTVLYALVKDPSVKVEHDRTAHRHEDVTLQPGAYQIRTQRGMTPAGWQRAID